MKELNTKIRKALKRKYPFVVYNEPESEAVNAVFQQDKSNNYSKDFSKDGFIFAPFNDRNRTLIIPFEKADEFSYLKNRFEPETKNNFVILKNDTDRKSHIELIKKGIDFIKSSQAKKIVLSRKEILKINEFDPYQVLEKLIFLYPNAFVYIWFHPLTGLWLGASPETLLSIQDSKFETMALAGTKKYKGSMEVVWDTKEKQEHQFVIDYIKEKLKSNELEIGIPFTRRAGSLVHICSIIKGNIFSDDGIFSIVEKLHPTPAVCGLPLDIAKQFIYKNEMYDREYYTGFLGIINQNKSTKLYVNLRCMRIDMELTKASLFVGGGITKDSNAKKEWEETVVKSEIMKQVL